MIPQVFVTEPTEMNTREFKLLSELIYGWTGINLNECKQPLLRSRLGKRLRALNLNTFAEYYNVVAEQGLYGAEAIEMVDAISTNLTEFFREPAHFDYLKRAFLPRWKKESCIRILSAGCSSGEEPYSIAMCAREAFGNDSAAKVKIVAGDISRRMLVQATNGIYSLKCVQSIPLERLHAHFLQGTGSQRGKVAVAPEVQALVHFQHLNLSAPLPFDKPFHAIFCRNVAIYFDRATQQKLVSRFSKALVPHGTLFLGHSESIFSENRHFSYVQPTVYEYCRKLGDRHG